MRKKQNKLVAYLKLLRIKQYVKNLLIFLPLFFSGTFFKVESFVEVVIGFFAFSAAASLVYIVNDYKDIEKDKKHPKKKHRPLASGFVSKREAVALGVGATVVAALLSLFIPFYAVAIIVLYVAINVAYSFWLKHVPLVDVAIVATGFYLRLLFGGYVVGIELSEYITLTVVFISLFMAFGKRRNELLRNGAGARGVLKYYSSDFLDKNMYVMVALSLAFYALWVINVNPSQLLVATVPLAAFLLIRYSYDIEKDDSDGDPSEVVLGDRVLQAMVVVFVIMMTIGIYK